MSYVPRLKQQYDAEVVPKLQERFEYKSSMQVLRKDDRVLVESVNIVTKHVKPSPTNPQGGIEKKEAPIHISNVMLVDGAGNATRVGRRRGDDGKLVRYSKKSDQTLN
jgi:large subunit ribosomal protein L24